MKAVAAIESDFAATDRVAGFDLLRGVCAVAVAVYHVLAWNDVAHLFTWGTYGVYMFFVLSGASMWLAYSRRFARGFSLARFLALRMVRLAPLYVMALALWLALHTYQTGFSPGRVAVAYLNLFFQHGLGNPGSTSQVVGGWSLGIEFVFYLLFPVFLALLAGRWWWLVLMVAFTSQHIFIASVFANGKGVVENWTAYTQFLAFVFYFVAGCLIARAISSGRLRPHWLGLPVLVGCIAVLGSTSWPSSPMSLTGLTGVGLSVVAVAAVAASAALRLGPVGIRAAEQLGRASYGVYILHPLLVHPTKAAGMGIAWTVGMTVAGSILLALIMERWYERPLQEWAKRR